MKPRVHLVANDAGGAEILSAWSEKYRNDYEITATLEGPALRIFQRDDHRAITPSDLGAVSEFGKRTENSGDFLLTGSSLESSLERRAIAYARDKNVRVVTFLDHWDLYRSRFGSDTDWHLHLPDEIWLGDSYAYAHAIREGFPADLLRLVANPYFEKIKASQPIESQQNSTGRLRILYICEPFSRKLRATFGREAEKYDTEETTLAKILASAQRVAPRIERITIRLHPSEANDKYGPVLAPFRNSLPLFVSNGGSLSDEIRAHDWVLGVESNALVVGLLLGKRVKSCVTGKPFEIALPHLEIERVRDTDQLFDDGFRSKGSSS
jgi:hypothetical protein